MRSILYLQVLFNLETGFKSDKKKLIKIYFGNPKKFRYEYNDKMNNFKFLTSTLHVKKTLS